VIEEETDLALIMHKSAKPSRQYIEAEQEASSTVGRIRRKLVESTIQYTNASVSLSWNTT